MLSLYRKASWTIVVSIAMFLILDISILFTNIWLSHQIERDAIGINLAGRQRMLSQQLSKTALQIRLLPADSPEITRLHQSLIVAYHLFDGTLSAFHRGGQVVDSRGKTLWIAPLTATVSSNVLSDALAIWAPWREVFKTGATMEVSDLDTWIVSLERFALEDNQHLLGLMNELTTHLEFEARQNAEHIRLFQTIAMLLALINFVVILIQFYRQIDNARRSQSFLNRIIDKIDSSVLIHRNDGEIVSCNKPACIMFGARQSQLVGANTRQIMQLKEGELVGFRLDDRGEFFAEIHSATLENDGGVCITTVHDVSAQRSIQNSLQEIAYHDALTHLPNRLLIHDRLKQEISRARRYEECFAVCFIDLDGFKSVNDQYGHDVGDRLLLRVTDCLRRCTRETDTVGRLGGDEFVMILSNINLAGSASQLARKVIDMIGDIRTIDGAEITIGASIGIALYPDHGMTVETLMKRSDLAMYEAKRAGKNSVRLAESMDQVIEVSSWVR